MNNPNLANYKFNASDLKQAFKVVGVWTNRNRSRRMFSANIGSTALVKYFATHKRSTELNDEVHNLLEYRLDKVVRPFAARPKLFVFDSLGEAHLGLEFYSRHIEDCPNYSLAILVGLASNLQRVEGSTVTLASVGKATTRIYTPPDFKTSLCDLFLPCEILPYRATIRGAKSHAV